MRITSVASTKEHEFVWPQKGDMPVEDRGVFIFTRPERSKRLALVETLVDEFSYETKVPGEEKPKTVTKRIWRPAKWDELLAGNFVGVRNVFDEAGNPITVNQQNPGNKLVYFFESNLGLDEDRYGRFEEDVSEWFRNHMLRMRTAERSGPFETPSADGTSATI